MPNKEGLLATATHAQSAASNKGVAWSEDEHVAFLNGLKSFGRGQWKQISRYYVPSRTPTQVASHAQKHFLRLSGATKRRSRFTTLDDAPKVSPNAAAAPVVEKHHHRQTQHHQQGLSTGSDAISSVSGVVDNHPAIGGGGGGALSAASMQFRSSQLSLPPISSTGIALGIPMPLPLPFPQQQQHQQQHQQQQMITSPTGGMLPMLRVLPGRLDLTKAAPSRSHSQISLQSKGIVGNVGGGVVGGGGGGTKVRQSSRKVTPSTRRAQLDELKEIREKLRPQTEQCQQHHRSKRASTGQDQISNSGSVCSDTTSTPHTALDALAGVAAALADSAFSPV